MSLSHNKIDRLFSSQLKDYEVTAPANAWQAIQKEIAVPTNKPQPFKIWRLFALAACFFSVSAFGFLLFYQQNISIKTPISAIKTKLKHFNTSAPTKISNPILIAESKATIAPINSISNCNKIDEPKINYTQEWLPFEKNAAKLFYSETKHQLKEQSEPIGIALASLESLNSLQFQNVNTDFNKNKTVTSNIKVSDELFISELLKKQLYFVQGFHLAIKGEFNNTWIIAENNTTENVFKYKTNYKFDGGMAYGLAAGYDFNNKIGIQLEWHVVSQMAQRSELIKGYYVQDQKIKLTYTNIPIIAKIKWCRLFAIQKNPVIMNYIIGAQYGRLQSKSYFNSKHEENSTFNNLNINQWNMVLGVNYDLYLNKFMFMTIGGRTTFGGNLQNHLFSNIKIDKVRNYSFGIEAALHYKIPNKKAK
jgi:hypothetical protein